MAKCRRKKISNIPNSPLTLDSLLDQYVRENCRRCHENYLSTLKTLTDFICGQPNNTQAPDGPPYIFDNHQWNLRCTSRQPIVNRMAENLKDIDTIDFKDFEELHVYVKSKKELHFGETCTYDFALRYGWNRKPRIVPRDYVYIHSKPRRAAEHLYSLSYLPELDTKLPLSNYKAMLRPSLTAADIEHFLCCFHDQILQLGKTS